MNKEINKKLGLFYDNNFYKRHTEGSKNSAEIILNLLFKIYKPLSVVDFGCGYGGWLMAAEKLGSKILKGFDGDWITKKNILSKNIEFVQVNMYEDFEIDKKYDLAISLEVAEHLSERYAKLFIDKLCKASDVILFSAATKFQGGTNHINEQDQSYWINLFKTNRYDCFDIIRPIIWENKDVEWWYKQNIFLFIRQNPNSNIKVESLKKIEKNIPNIINPENYKSKVKELIKYKKQIQEPTIRFCLSVIKKYIFNIFK